MSEAQTSAGTGIPAQLLEIVSVTQTDGHVHVTLRIVDREAFLLAAFLEKNRAIPTLAHRILTAAIEYVEAPKSLFQTAKRRRRKRRAVAPRSSRRVASEDGEPAPRSESKSGLGPPRALASESEDLSSARNDDEAHSEPSADSRQLLF